VSSTADRPLDFDDADMLTGEFEAAGGEGMPDPLANRTLAGAPVEEPVLDSKSKAPRPGLLRRLTMASPYTVMLGIALAFLLVGIFCLFMELGAYRFDYSANEAKTVRLTVPPALSVEHPAARFWA